MVVANTTLKIAIVLHKPQFWMGANTTVMPCMVLPVMVSLTTDTRLAFITAANVFIELSLYPFQVVGSIPFKLSGF
jgi:hypothetical protein|tara:strand:- start:830 stop:1057 length:228 start_codon:yes stop_codon:yes gene_type:complete